LSSCRLRYRLFAAAAFLAAALAVAYSLTVAADLRLFVDHLRDALIFTALAILAEEMAVEVADRVSFTASNLPILLAVMFQGRVAALLVGTVVGAWGCWRENSAEIAVFNSANFTLSTFLAASVYAVAAAALGVSPGTVSFNLLVCGAVAAAVFESSNLALSSLGTWARYDNSFLTFWRDELPPFLQSLAVTTALGLGVAGLYAEAGPVAAVLLLAPVFASQYMFKLLVREREHLAKQKELSDQYLEMNIGLAAAMVVLLDSKDEYTASHSAGVAMYCRDMAQVLGLPESDAEALHLAGLLHDLGKVGTPDAILRKEGSLTEPEWEYIRQHPGKGAEVLSHFVAYKDVAAIVRYHHERLDGSGYPDGVEGDRIPEMSKILAVADSYHAMTSTRPYRKAMSSFEALKELRSIAGSRLEAQYVEALARVLRDKSLAYRDGTSTDFMVEYERGRINLRLRGQSLADLSGTAVAEEDPAVG
jgi:putative nucleotidyltransferase with HDIG domain